MFCPLSIFSFLLAFFICFSHFNLTVPADKFLGKRLCMSSIFSIAMLNGTCFLGGSAKTAVISESRVLLNEISKLNLLCVVALICCVVALVCCLAALICCTQRGCGHLLRRSSVAWLCSFFCLVVLIYRVVVVVCCVVVLVNCLVVLFCCLVVLICCTKRGCAHLLRSCTNLLQYKQQFEPYSVSSRVNTTLISPLRRSWFSCLLGHFWQLNTLSISAHILRSNSSQFTSNGSSQFHFVLHFPLINSCRT